MRAVRDARVALLTRDWGKLSKKDQGIIIREIFEPGSNGNARALRLGAVKNLEIGVMRDSAVMRLERMLTR